MTGSPVKPPDPCRDGGEHELHPHDHSHIPDEYRFPQRCSGRLWCGRCGQWLDGAKCKLVPAAKAA